MKPYYTILFILILIGFGIHYSPEILAWFKRQRDVWRESLSRPKPEKKRQIQPDVPWPRPPNVSRPPPPRAQQFNEIRVSQVVKKLNAEKKKKSK